MQINVFFIFLRSTTVILILFIFYYSIPFLSVRNPAQCYRLSFIITEAVLRPLNEVYNQVRSARSPLSRGGGDIARSYMACLGRINNKGKLTSTTTLSLPHRAARNSCPSSHCRDGT